MRLFLAVTIDAAARAALGRLAAAVKAELDRPGSGRAPHLKWVSASHLHLTLRFFGEVGDDVAATLQRIYSEPVRAVPFDLTFDGLGVFPPSGPSRVLWAGATRGARELVALHALTAARLAGVPVGPEDRPFSPHLTLARLREPARLDLAALQRAAGPRLPCTTAVSAVTLYRSHLAPAGPSYDVMAEAVLEP